MAKNFNIIFYVLMIVHPGMILVNNQLDAHFFVYIYFYSLYVSGSHAPIIRRIIVPIRQPAYVTLCSIFFFVSLQKLFQLIGCSDTAFSKARIQNSKAQQSYNNITDLPINYVLFFSNRK